MIATSRAALLTLCVVLAVGTAACGDGSSSDDKAGGQERDTTVLRMANAMGGSDELGPFFDEVTRRSRGSLRIEPRNSWRVGQVDYETGLVRDVKAGKAEIGWVGARAWHSLGLKSFDALNAPLLIDDYGLEQAVVRSPMVGQMLSRLRGLGVVPIGVLPGPMREALGRTPLRRPADFAGKTIGVQSSAIAADTMRALGATPKSFAVTGSIDDFDGIEQQLTSIDGNGYDAVAKYVTGNLKLWPRPLVLFMNRDAFARLSHAQQQALRDAVRNAVPQTIRFLVERDPESVRNLCRRGAVLVSATAAELGALRTAVRPVYAALERDPETKAFIARIRAMKSARHDASPANAPECEQRASTTGVTGAGAQIAGSYAVTVTRKELLTNPSFEYGEDNPGNYGDMRLSFEKGRWTLENLTISYTSGGTYSLDADTITLRTTTTGEVFVFHWSLYRGALRFTKISAGPTPYVIHPWIRDG